MDNNIGSALMESMKGKIQAALNAEMVQVEDMQVRTGDVRAVYGPGCMSALAACPPTDCLLQHTTAMRRVTGGMWRSW